MALGSPADVDISTLRIAYYIDNGSSVTPTPETVAAVKRAAKTFESLSAEITQDAPNDLLMQLAKIRGGNQILFRPIAKVPRQAAGNKFQVIARPWNEHISLAAAAQLEAHTGGGRIRRCDTAPSRLTGGA